MGDIRKVTLVPITPEEFGRKMHRLFRWNMEPLTHEEIAHAADAVSCPICKRLRYTMWKAVEPYAVTYMGEYCTCPHKGESYETSGALAV